MNEKRWVAIYGNAVSITENKPEGYAKDITLRYPIYVPFDGEKIKITLDNYCGKDDISISKTVFYNGKDFFDVTFNGSKSVSIEAGVNTVSDEIECSLEKGCEAFVSIYLADYTDMRSGVYTEGPLSGGLYASGDMTRVKDIDINCKRNISITYFLTNVSIYSDKACRSICCYGDSITAQSWPDFLYEMCNDKNIAIIRRATSGSRILREYSCLTYESYGLMGKKRFPHELPTDGCDTVIIQQGINDIIHPVGVEVNPFRPMSDLPTAKELIEGLKWYIGEARKAGLKVYVGTLLPIKGWRTYAPFREELRNEYNDFIRNTDLIDGCIDFDKAVRDENDHTAFHPSNDSGDHLHPSKEGYMVMAKEVYEKLIGGNHNG